MSVDVSCTPFSMINGDIPLALHSCQARTCLLVVILLLEF